MRGFGHSVFAVTARRRLKGVFLTKPWRPEDDRILGTRSDSEVALLLGGRLSNVAWRRRKLGIPCRFEHRPWAPHELDLLGKVPDAEIARVTGHPLTAVAFKRQQLGRPKPDQVMNYWSPEEDKLLGTMTDTQVARRINRDVVAVRKRRARLGIPNRVPQRHVWTPGQTVLLGTMSDVELAAKLNVPPHLVSYKRKSFGHYDAGQVKKYEDLRLALSRYNRGRCISIRYFRLLGELSGRLSARILQATCLSDKVYQRCLRLPTIHCVASAMQWCPKCQLAW